MKKVVLNYRFGGYELSKKAYEFLGLPWDGFGCAYDDYNYTCEISEYDGYESLRLTPIVHKSKIETMTVNEIIEYLTSINIRVVD